MPAGSPTRLVPVAGFRRIPVVLEVVVCLHFSRIPGDNNTLTREDA